MRTIHFYTGSYSSDNSRESPSNEETYEKHEMYEMHEKHTNEANSQCCPILMEESMRLHVSRLSFLKDSYNSLSSIKQRCLNSINSLRGLIVNAIFFDSFMIYRDVAKSIENTIYNILLTNMKNNNFLWYNNNLLWYTPDISLLNSLLAKYGLSLLNGENYTMDARYALLFIESLIRFTNNKLTYNIYINPCLMYSEEIVQEYKKLYSDDIFQNLTKMPYDENLLYSAEDVLFELLWTNLETFNTLDVNFNRYTLFISPLFLKMSKNDIKRVFYKGERFHPAIFIAKKREELNEQIQSIPTVLINFDKINIKSPIIKKELENTMISALKIEFDEKLAYSLKHLGVVIKDIKVPASFDLLINVFLRRILIENEHNYKMKKDAIMFIELASEIRSLKRLALIFQDGKRLTLDDYTYLYKISKKVVKEEDFEYYDSKYFNNPAFNKFVVQSIMSMLCIHKLKDNILDKNIKVSKLFKIVFKKHVEEPIIY